MTSQLYFPPAYSKKASKARNKNYHQGSLLVNCTKSKNLGVTKSLKLPSDTTSMPRDYLKATTALTKSMFYCMFHGLIKQKLRFLAINTYGGFVVKKKKDGYNEKNLIPTVK